MPSYDSTIPEGFELESMPEEAAVEGDIPSGFEVESMGESGNPDMAITDIPEDTGRGNAALPALQGLTFGWGDEAMAGVLAAYGTLMPELAGGLPDQFSLEDNYRGIRNQIRGDTETYANENPAKAAMAEMGGAMLTGGAGIVKAGAKPTAGMIERLMKNAGIGAAEGAVYGAGRADEVEDMAEAGLDEAKTGAMFGAAGGEVLAKAQRWFAGKSDFQEELLKKIGEGSEDIDTAYYKVIKDSLEDTAPPINLNAPRLAAPEGVAEEVMEKARPVGTPRLAKDRAQVNAARQGVSEGFLPVYREANVATKKKLLEQNKIADQARKNAKYALEHRPSDVAGDSALERFKHVRTVNKKAGDAIDAASKDLKDFRVDFNPSVNDFLSSLQGMGVRIGSPEEFLQKVNMGNVNQRKKALFNGADFEGFDEAERVLDKVLQRMLSNGDGMTAYEGHRLKRYLDLQVSFGPEGAKIKDVPQLESAFKYLRHNIDSVLDDNFDAYRLANEDYAKTIAPMKEFKRLMPKHVDLLDPSKLANSAVGTQLRTIMSNSRGRVPMLNVIKDLDNVSQEYGKLFDDDMLTQIIHMDELERLSGSAARTGLSGEVGKAVREGVGYLNKSPSQAAADYVINRGDDLFFGEVNEENLIKALNELLKVD